MDSVAKHSPEMARMNELSANGRALMGGTRAMRAAGETYLPKFEAESSEAYRARLRSSWLFNGYRKTVKDMTGRVFDKPIEIVDGSERLKTWATNIDLAGRDLSGFARDVFEDGLDAGIAWIMVDAPAREGTVTQAQAERQNLRPFLVHLRTEDILGFRAETVGNAQTVTMLRIMEIVKEVDPKDEFAEAKIDQVRVLDIEGGRVRTRLYRKAGKEAKWEQFEGDTYSDMTEITVVPFYANRTGFWTAEPTLDDLADINIAHWQSQSDQRNILHFARVPIFVRTGWNDEASPLAIGAATSMDTTNENAKAMWVEHSGQAIGAGRQDLKDLEFQMETHGLQLLTARPGAQSATGEALDASKETSQLAMIADNLRDAFEQALKWMSVYGGAEEQVTVSVNTDFGVSMMGAQELTAMLSAVNTGNMSRRTFLGEMARRGMIRADTDIDEEMDMIEAEGGDLMNEGASQ